MFFNARRSKPSNPLVRPIEEQDERESQKLWFATVQAVKDRNHELATDEKTKVEDRQREEREIRAREGVEWQPRLFRSVQGGPGAPEEEEEELEWIINAKMCVPLEACPFLVDLGTDTTQRQQQPAKANRTDPGHLPHSSRTETIRDGGHSSS